MNKKGSTEDRRSKDSPFLRAGQEAYEQQLKRLQQQNQQGGYRGRKRASMDPPAALDPDDLPASPSYMQRALRSTSTDHVAEQIESLYDDPSSTHVRTYTVPTFKHAGDNKTTDLPYTWQDVVLEAERRRANSISSSSNGGSNHPSPLYQKQVSRDVKGGTPQKQQQEDYYSSDPSYSSAFKRDGRKRISQSSSATNSPTSPMVSPLKRRYEPKSNPERRAILSVPNINGEGEELQYETAPYASMTPSLPFQYNQPIPPLPLVRTVKATKDNPDQPVGLFLKKAKNGAVLVHSVSPASIFSFENASDKCLISGQEVLSVNEKRVSDPKMAASLICQAKGRLSLRVSTVGRQRGFLYCQVKRRMGRTASNKHHGSSTQAKDHGIRFVTTSVDGVRRGTASDGLVRVSHVDPNGMFASRNPLNRMRIGSIVLTVNGAPVGNGRIALEKIMESSHLIEVLHCDERVWREEWVMAGLAKVLISTGAVKDSVTDESAFTVLTRKVDVKRHRQYHLLDQYWEMSWTVGHNEVNLSKVGTSDCAFKLVFNDEVGTCKCETMDGKNMPSTDEFDISSLVKSVNNSQKEMMTLLQHMLSRAKLESTARRRSSLSRRTFLPAVDDDDRSKKVQRMQSYECLEDFIRNEELPISDSTQAKEKSCKRRSTSGLDDDAMLLEDFEMLFIDEAGRSNSSKGNKLQDYSAQRHRMEETHIDYDKRRRDFKTKSSNGSMFSADLLEELVNDLEQELSESTESTDTNATHSFDENDQPPPSPRDTSFNVLDKSANVLDESAKSSFDTSLDDKNAYITGVWRDVASKYDISDTVLGTGGFGEVKDCYDKSTGKIYVVKAILKPLPGDTVKINLIRNEILLLHEANHPNIVELKDLFEDDQYVHIVMERCAGGDLFDRVVEDNPRRIRSINEGMKHEATTANAMRSIIQVVKYLHSKHIVHRDIKPEHFLLTTKERETQKIKLIDFGLARKHDPGSDPMSTFTGSPSFVAPEVIARSYDHMCDNWSTGVTAYFLLTGMLPFDGRNDEETFEIISRGHFTFPSSSIFLSSDAKDFVAKLLVKDPTRRMTAAEALLHPWLRKTAQC